MSFLPRPSSTGNSTGELEHRTVATSHTQVTSDSATPTQEESNCVLSVSRRPRDEVPHGNCQSEQKQ